MLLATVLVPVFELQGVVANSRGLVLPRLSSAWRHRATLPYLLDRVLAPRLGGLLGTLVFPLAVTTVWYLMALLNPHWNPWTTPPTPSMATCHCCNCCP